MDWTTPSYAEIKMDAEIGSYQTDERGDEPPFVGVSEREETPAAAE